MPKSPRSWGPIQSVTYRYNTQKIQMLLPYTIETGDLVNAAPASRARDGPGIRRHGGLDGLVSQHAGTALVLTLLRVERGKIS
jgi:hypothetical protein